jgi:hypothetical protein
MPYEHLRLNTEPVDGFKNTAFQTIMSDPLNRYLSPHLRNTDRKLTTLNFGTKSRCLELPAAEKRLDHLNTADVEIGVTYTLSFFYIFQGRNVIQH